MKERKRYKKKKSHCSPLPWDWRQNPSRIFLWCGTFLFCCFIYIALARAVVEKKRRREDILCEILYMLVNGTVGWHRGSHLNWSAGDGPLGKRALNLWWKSMWSKLRELEPAGRRSSVVSALTRPAVPITRGRFGNCLTLGTRNAGNREGKNIHYERREVKPSGERGSFFFSLAYWSSFFFSFFFFFVFSLSSIPIPLFLVLLLLLLLPRFMWEGWHHSETNRTGCESLSELRGGGG